MNLADSFEHELRNILSYWSAHAPDKAYGGFHGKIDSANRVEEHAPKGAVLNARILWTFSAAYNQAPRPEYLQQATTAFEYLATHFTDLVHGGVYWSVDYLGQPLDTKKQIYALAFAIYGLSEFYLATGKSRALEAAQELFQVIEQHSFDTAHGGYLEALARDWTPLADLRLSDKDANEKKSMNTHLHVVEAYTNLYRVWPDALLKKQLKGLLEVFARHIINAETHHLTLFFDADWTPKSTAISFGHDIEAAWLLLEAAEVLRDEQLIAHFRALAVRMAQSAAEGLARDGQGLSYEFEPARAYWNRERHWWVQAEALVGFLNAYEISGEQFFYDTFLAAWEFTQRHIIDHERGEWRWGVHEDLRPMEGEDKAGFWKCPYHNSRACLEIIRRLRRVPTQTPPPAPPLRERGAF